MVKLIRKATLEDVPQLVSLAIQMWKSHTVDDLAKNVCGVYVLVGGWCCGWWVGGFVVFVVGGGL